MSNGITILRAVAYPRFQVWKISGIIYLVERNVGFAYNRENVPSTCVFKSRSLRSVEEFVYKGLSTENTAYLDAKVRSVIQVLLCKRRDKFYKKMEARYEGKGSNIQAE